MAIFELLLTIIKMFLDFSAVTICTYHSKEYSKKTLKLH